MEKLLENKHLSFSCPRPARCFEGTRPPAAWKPQMTGLHQGLGPCNASARNRCASYPARRHAIAANCCALSIAPRERERPTRIINLSDRPVQKNVHVQFDVWGVKASQPNRMGKAAAWSRAVSHRLIIRSTVHEGSIARQARYRCAAFALLQDHSASSEEQNAAIQTKKKKGKKMNNQKS